MISQLNGQANILIHNFEQQQNLYCQATSWFNCVQEQHTKSSSCEKSKVKNRQNFDAINSCASSQLSESHSPKRSCESSIDHMESLKGLRKSEIRHPGSAETWPEWAWERDNAKAWYHGFVSDYQEIFSHKNICHLQKEISFSRAILFISKEKREAVHYSSLG